MIISAVRRVAAVVLTVMALALPATAGTANAASTPTTTRIVGFYPFTASGALKSGYAITHTYGHATCSPGSDIAAHARLSRS